MKLDIIITGVGGQGILSIAYVLVSTADEMGLYVKQTEVHGMSQRGGGVESHVRISDKPIHSDTIGFKQADFVLGIEPMESLRYLKYLAPTGKIITSTSPIVNISNYPSIENIYSEIQQHPHIVMDAKLLAKHAGSGMAENMVAVGAFLPFSVLKREVIDSYVMSLFKRKGERIVDVNIKALKSGEAASDFYKKALEAGIAAEKLFYPAIRRAPEPVESDEIDLWKALLSNGNAQAIVNYIKETEGLYQINKAAMEGLKTNIDASQLEQAFKPAEK